MSAPDPKAVEVAIAEAEAAMLDERRGPAGILITLIDAARAYLRASTSPQGAEPVNQCDGCRRGLVLDRDIHRDASGRAVMGCTAYLYAAPQGAEIAREALETVRHWIDDEPQDKPPYWAIRQMIAALTPTEETKHE